MFNLLKKYYISFVFLMAIHTIPFLMLYLITMDPKVDAVWGKVWYLFFPILYLVPKSFFKTEGDLIFLILLQVVILTISRALIYEMFFKKEA